MKTWTIYLALQNEAKRLPEAGDLLEGTGKGGTLSIGPGSEELSNLRRAFSGPIEAIHLPEIDMHDMPFAPGHFCRVVASNVLEHSLAPYVALMEIRRVLKLGAEAHFTMPQFDGPECGTGPLHLHCLDEKVWKELLHKTGYELVEYRYDLGYYDTRAGYHVYHCTTVRPPHPHDRVLAALIRGCV